MHFSHEETCSFCKEWFHGFHFFPQPPVGHDDLPVTFFASPLFHHPIDSSLADL